MSRPVLLRRQAGLLLHPTSLPESAGNGDLGPQAYHFVDFLSQAGFGVWQMLPLGPTHLGGSPYKGLSVFAGNTLLISGYGLVEIGLISEDEIASPYAENPQYARAIMLNLAYERFMSKANSKEKEEFANFSREHAFWLEDYALFMALRKENKERPWNEWPKPVRNREPHALKLACERLAELINEERFRQFMFYCQLLSLKRYANERGVRLFGDLPIFVDYDSADVWAHRENFRLNASGLPSVVTGVPPDYFSKEGQRWGNPHYDWSYMERTSYAWWKDRLRVQLALFDLLRIDHFRGFEAFWEISAEEPSAINGRWVAGPGDSFFRAMLDKFGKLHLVAEDLGVITESVRSLRHHWKLPGMCILQFAFDGDAANPYLPHNHESLSVVYTGTHDNNTTLGWFKALDKTSRERVLDYLGYPTESMPWPLIRAALGSVSDLAVVPFQDVLELGSDHRMNTPGTTTGNWQWRFSWQQIASDLVDRLHHLLSLYGRVRNRGESIQQL